ncbi:MAG: hypothetical protein OXC44_01380 [Proteobacteria bacterium]|nr:hypothetical protein [Pseudomonadota bacterium]
MKWNAVLDVLKDVRGKYVKNTTVYLLMVMLMSPQYVFAQESSAVSETEESEGDKEKSMWDGFSASVRLGTTIPRPAFAFQRRDRDTREKIDYYDRDRDAVYLNDPKLSLSASYDHSFFKGVNSSASVTVQDYISALSSIEDTTLKALPGMGLSVTWASGRFPSLTLYESDVFDFKTGTLSVYLASSYNKLRKFGLSSYYNDPKESQLNVLQLTHSFDTLGSYPLALFGENASVRANSSSIAVFALDPLNSDWVKRNGYIPLFIANNTLSINFSKVIDAHTLGVSFSNLFLTYGWEWWTSDVLGNIKTNEQTIALSYVNANYNFSTNLALERSPEVVKNPFSKTKSFSFSYSVSYSL